MSLGTFISVFVSGLSVVFPFIITFTYFKTVFVNAVAYKYGKLATPYLKLNIPGILFKLHKNISHQNLLFRTI